MGKDGLEGEAGGLVQLNIRLERSVIARVDALVHRYNTESLESYGRRPYRPLTRLDTLRHVVELGLQAAGVGVLPGGPEPAAAAVAGAAGRRGRRSG